MIREEVTQRLHFYFCDTSDLGTGNQSWKTLYKFYKNACEKDQLLEWKMWNEINMKLKYSVGDSWKRVEREKREANSEIIYFSNSQSCNYSSL